jgi:hypothetical protein
LKPRPVRQAALAAILALSFVPGVSHAQDFRGIMAGAVMDLRCPRCFGKDLAPSHRIGLRDSPMDAFGRVPGQCRFCGKRIYVRIEDFEELSAVSDRQSAKKPEPPVADR